MRTVWKMAFSLLIWPISVTAQDSPPPNQPNPSAQSPSGSNDYASGLEATTPPSPAPAPILPVRTPPPLNLPPIKQPPIAPGYFPVLNLSAGYSVTDLAIPSSGHVALTGIDVSLAADGGRRMGAKLDLSYALSPDAFKSGHRADVLSYLAGPTFSLWSGRSLTTYVHVLAGGARIAGPFLNASGELAIGRVHYPALDFGGSAEYRLSRAFGFRVTIDCLHAHFFNSSGAVRGQNDLRVVNSIVYYVGEPVRSRHRQSPLL